VEESVAQAGRAEQIHHALTTKISRERVAEELEKMIKGAWVAPPGTND